MTTTDPRTLQLAKTRLRLAHQALGSTPNWNNLTDGDRKFLLDEAAEWLAAAVEAGIAPPAVRPTDDHDAVWVDEQGFLYGEYRTSPPSDALIRLVWASELTASKADLEESGARFRLLGWSA